MTDVTARDIIDSYAGSYWLPSEGVADHIYGQVAHELAEQIREAYGECATCGCGPEPGQIADLIDPEEQ